MTGLFIYEIIGLIWAIYDNENASKIVPNRPWYEIMIVCVLDIFTWPLWATITLIARIKGVL